MMKITFCEDFLKPSYESKMERETNDAKMCLLQWLQITSLQTQNRNGITLLFQQDIPKQLQE
jgi:hypothetical protein